MKKTDKKNERAIRDALTNVCDIALDEVTGFQWLTHLVNYSRFPDSLSVVCIFSTENDLSKALLAKRDDFLRSLIRENLRAVGIAINDAAGQVRFDTEEACEREHGGKWRERLR